MPSNAKTLDIRFGEFACSISGYDDPAKVLRQVVRALQDLAEERPEMTGLSVELTAETLDRLMADLRTDPSGLHDGAGLIPGLAIFRDGSQMMPDAPTEAAAAGVGWEMPDDPPEPEETRAEPEPASVDPAGEEAEEEASPAPDEPIRPNFILRNDPDPEPGPEPEPADAWSSSSAAGESEPVWTVPAENGRPEDLSDTPEPAPEPESEVPAGADPFAPPPAAEAEVDDAEPVWGAAPPGVEPEAPESGPEPDRWEPAGGPRRRPDDDDGEDRSSFLTRTFSRMLGGEVEPTFTDDRPDQEPEPAPEPEPEPEPDHAGTEATGAPRRGAGPSAERPADAAGPPRAGEPAPEGNDFNLFVDDTAPATQGAETEAPPDEIDTGSIFQAAGAADPEPEHEEDRRHRDALTTRLGLGGVGADAAEAGDDPGAEDIDFADDLPEPEPPASTFQARAARFQDGARLGTPGEDAPEGSEDHGSVDDGAAEAAAFARSAGAETVPDLLAAAAAFLTIRRGQTRFSRRDVMDIFDKMPGEQPRSLEARIKGFGRLVREGTLVLVEDGVFAMSQSARARYET